MSSKITQEIETVKEKERNKERKRKGGREERRKEGRKKLKGFYKDLQAG